MLDEANAYERGMDDDLTFQTVRELAGTAYMAGRSAPPTAVEIEAVAKKLLWWDMAPAWEDVMPSEDCFWTLAEPEMRANYLRDAREMLEIARKAVTNEQDDQVCGMRSLRRDRRHLLRHMPVLRLQAGGRHAGRLRGTAMVTLDPPPDLVEIADALDIMAKPHVGSGWANLNFDGLPCTTPRQEAIWMEHNGITRGD